jgi:tetratricopeptide (TPR) repeat protein
MLQSKRDNASFLRRHDVVLAQISDTINIFFSLAPTTKDTDLFKELRKHLRLLMRQGLIEIWSDSEIRAGSNTLEYIKDQMSMADIIVLLFSADFFDSDQCVKEEMPYALEQHQIRAATIIPVLLRPTLWEGLQFEHTHFLPQNGKAVSIWDDLDNALTDVAKGIHRVVEEIARRLSGNHTPVKRPQLPLRTLPYRRNPYFTDREDILEKLHQFFTTEQTPQTRVQALRGIGGIGKTALATEYACLYYREYQAILWLNAITPELLSSGILSLADQIGIPAPDDLNEQQRFVAIKQWLQFHDRWLVVLDNLEDFPIMDQFIPLYSEGHVLLTTQAQATGPFATAISVDQMGIDDGSLLLLRRSKPTPSIGLSEAPSETEILHAREIAQEFAGYPLALDQAGAYIEENQCSLASYLTLYRQQEAILLSRRGRLANDHLDPVTTTLELTFQKIMQIDPLAMDLLRFLAFLHADALPDEMIIHGASSLDGSLHKLALDRFAFDDTMNTLQRFSLVHRRTDSTTLNMHHILQVVIKQELTKQQQKQFAKQAVHLVNFIFPDVFFTNWKECERYMPQAQYCATLIHEFKLTGKEGALLLERLGFYCFQRGRYIEAETYLQQALNLYEHQRHVDALNITQTLNSLGLLYHQQARYKEAEALHQRALQLRERALEPDHPKIMESLHNLAMIYGDLGKYQQAESLYLSVLSVEEKAKGPDHPDVADTLNELGLTYAQQGQFADAERAYLRVLAIYEQVRDPNHPDLTYPLDGLGTLAEQRGDYQHAKSLYQRTFTICEQAYGEMHPETAHSIYKLAGIAASQGDYQQAEDRYQQAFTIYEQILGPRHPDVALILNDRALLATKQKDYQQAEPLYQRALDIYEIALGAEHPSVASVLNNLGQLLRMTGSKEQAKKLLQRALAIREKALDATHPDIAQSLSNLADLMDSSM